jgi:hypothetical protein
LKFNSRTIRESAPKGFAAFLLVLVPAIVFEKYTYYLYTISSPTFFTFSGDRLWFDIGWFIASGAISALILGRKNILSVVPPVAGAWLFIVVVYDIPFCQAAECYINSTDGFAWLRDFLLFSSLGVLACTAVLARETHAPEEWSERNRRIAKLVYAFAVSVLVVYALGFFPISHLFAGVTVPYPLNYAQWFLAGAPAFVGAFFASLRILEQTKTPRSYAYLLGFFSGIAGTVVSVSMSTSIPCEACSNYGVSIASIILLASACAVAGILLARRSYAYSSFLAKRGLRSKVPSVTIAATIVVFVILLLGFFFSVNYQMSVVNELGPDVALTPFSPVEVGHSFVYSAGYLDVSRVTTNAVGASVNFGNSSIASSPSNFLAAGVGDQSPNCCKDGLDLAYRIDAAIYSNGTEAVLARAWWACDVNIACGGYSWQQLLHYGSATLPAASLSRGVNLKMSWNTTVPASVDWFYQINGSTGWTEFSSFISPKIQNHYFDAGVFYVGTGNHPSGDAFFYQFGVSSAYEIKNSAWHVLIYCPWLVVNNTDQCLTSTRFVQGRYSYWKVLYTFGETYSGISFSYLGNYTVTFYYTGRSPSDETRIW